MRGIPRSCWRSDRRISKQANAFWRAEIPREKLECALDELEAKIAELLETIQKDMLERASKATENPIPMLQRIWKRWVDIFNNKPGFVKAMWCG